MYTITLVHQKGGVGKTTLSACLAVAAYLDGKAVGILDLDPQGSAYKWGKRRRERAGGLGQEPDPLVFSVTLASMRDEWEKLRAAGAEYIFIDTPPRLAQEMAAACELADVVLIPCRPTVKDLEIVEPTIKLANSDKVRPTFVVLNASRKHGSRADEAEAFITAKRFPVCPARISNLVGFDDADGLGLSPQETEPRGTAAEQVIQVYQYTRNLLDQYTNQPKKEDQIHGQTTVSQPSA